MNFIFWNVQLVHFRSSSLIITVIYANWKPTPLLFSFRSQQSVTWAPRWVLCILEVTYNWYSLQTFSGKVLPVHVQWSKWLDWADKGSPTMWLCTKALDWFAHRQSSTTSRTSSISSTTVSVEEADVASYIGGFVCCKLKQRHSAEDYINVNWFASKQRGAFSWYTLGCKI